eukprot:GEMP01013799.1.p1 GENE.GEMP01013799.1~~GEMP01013799.1.p1  ORF type:complete len:484 (+),score=133.47 GEMP01013799.1:337-1788(+)
MASSSTQIRAPDISQVYRSYLKDKLHGILDVCLREVIVDRPSDVGTFVLEWLKKNHDSAKDAQKEKNRTSTEEQLRAAVRRLEQQIAALEKMRSEAGGTNIHKEVVRTTSKTEKTLDDDKSGREENEKEDEGRKTEKMEQKDESVEKDIKHHTSGAEDVVAPKLGDNAAQHEVVTEEHKAADKKEIEGNEAELLKIRQMKEKTRRDGVSAAAISYDAAEDWEKPKYDKPDEILKVIKVVFDNDPKLSVLFGHLSTDSRAEVIDAMFLVHVEAGEAVIKQGDPGDNFYIVGDGNLDVLVRRDNDSNQQKVMEAKRGSVFGELALMYDAPRQATVIATQASSLLALDRRTFKRFLMGAEDITPPAHYEVLDRVPWLQKLTKYELNKLSAVVTSEAFDGGEDIGCDGKIYIFDEGDATVFGGEPLESLRPMHAGDFFGNCALLGEHSACTAQESVKAAGDGCAVLIIEKEDFEELVKKPLELVPAQ